MAVSRRGMLQNMLQQSQSPGGNTTVDDPTFQRDLTDVPLPSDKVQRNPDDARTVLEAAQSDPVIAALSRIIGLDRMTGGVGLPAGQSLADIPGGE